MDKEIIKGNKLIAEFMGFIYDRPCLVTGKQLFGIEDCRYHSSWDWLMPVYIKIVKEEMCGEDEQAVILFNIMYERLGDGDGIEEVWKYIVQFIKWYNQQNHLNQNK